ncbi:hypothetical protein HN643_06325 [Candidatus Falkowbacteria bacterium]|jgi:hypothetical protein|nr:hypothetical protein [Candidatus Falkowbacteria bacterium]
MRKILRRIWRSVLLFLLVLLMLVTYPFYWLAMKLVNRFGTEYIRCRNGNIQLPIVTYHAKKNGRTLMFAPTIPLADPEYYAELNKLVRIHQTCGYSILHDKIRPLTKEQRLKLQPAEWEAKRQLQAVYAGLRWIKQVIGLASQPRSLPYRKNRQEWQNVDMSEVEFLARVSATKSYFFKQIPDFKKPEQVSDLTKWVLTKLFNKLVLVAMAFELYVRFSKKRSKLWQIVINSRNEIGHIGLNRVQSGNIFMLWGVDRYSDMNAVLNSIGYKIVNKRWVSAYQLRKTGWRVPLRLAWQFIIKQKK